MRNDTAHGMEMPRVASGTASTHWPARRIYVEARQRAQDAWVTYNRLKAEADAAYAAWRKEYEGAKP